MKTIALIILEVSLFVIVVGALLFTGYSTGYYAGRKSSTTVVPYLWQPKVGDRVQTTWETHMGNTGKLRFVTLTNVVHVGTHTCQSGILVYGDGLPGVDSSWVKPVP